MMRLLVALALIALLGFSGAWVADHPGDVTIFWFDWRIDTSVAFLLGAALIASLLLTCIIILLRWFIGVPVHFSRRRSLKQLHLGLSELTYSVAALAASDIKTAALHTRKAEKLLGSHTPLTLLLSAQIARSEGDEVKTRELLEKMLAHKETEYLAARSLSEKASSQQQFALALPLAERATAVNPREKAPAVALTGLHVRLGQWQEALLAADRACRKGALTRSERNYYKGIVHLRQGQSLLDDGQADAALAHARACRKLLPHFLPAALFSARAYHACGKTDKALASILTQWKQAPHPELAALLRVIMAKDAPARQMKYAHKLAALAPNHVESQLALAELAIKYKDWAAARKALKAALAKEESARACKLMAYVEQGEFSDYDASGRWLARGAEAPGESVWACASCAHTAEHWQPHCAHCGSFDTLAWKSRNLAFVGGE